MTRCHDSSWNRKEMGSEEFSSSSSSFSNFFFLLPCTGLLLTSDKKRSGKSHENRSVLQEKVSRRRTKTFFVTIYFVSRLLVEHRLWHVKFFGLVPAHFFCLISPSFRGRGGGLIGRHHLMSVYIYKSSSLYVPRNKEKKKKVLRLCLLLLNGCVVMFGRLIPEFFSYFYFFYFLITSVIRGANTHPHALTCRSLHTDVRWRDRA